ncbi:hypothetical protein [Spongiactinospora rosea]|nr:hypothetical protein [Spongiactinospora rosea]
MAAVLVGVQTGPASAATYPVQLWMDKGSYNVGEYPYYSVTGPPYTPIYWSSTRDGSSTGEEDAYYGHRTDAHGNWTSFGGVWTSSHVGTWSKIAKLNGITATAYFSVC